MLVEQSGKKIKKDNLIPKDEDDDDDVFKPNQ